MANSEPELTNSSGGDSDKDPSLTPAAGGLLELIPEVVVRNHLIQYLDQPEDMESLMLASPSISKVIVAHSSTEAWMSSNLANSQAYRAHFRKHSIAIMDGIHRHPSLQLLPRVWLPVLENYFDKIYGMEPNYSRLPFLRQDYSKPFFHTPSPTYLWLFENWQYWDWIEAVKLSSADVLSWEKYLKAEGEPLLARYLKLVGCFKEPMWHSALQLLGKVGPRIRKLELQNPVVSKIGSGSLFLSLERLRLSFEQVRSLSALVLRQEKEKDEDSETIQQLDNSSLLPPLRNLKNLKLAISLATYDLFNPYWDQLTTLDVEGSSFLSWYDPGKHSSFRNLKRLGIPLLEPDHFFKLKAFQSQLKELRVTCGPKTDLLTLFYMMELVVPEVSAVSVYIKNEDYMGGGITLKDLDVDEDEARLKIRLAQMRILELINYTCIYEKSFDGLLCLAESLAYVYLGATRKFRAHQPCSGDKVLKIFSNLNNLYQSNVWELMPRLVEVKVGPELNTRAIYEDKIQRKSGSGSR